MDYQVGDKFEIEIEEILTAPVLGSYNKITDITNKPELYYKIKGFDSLVFNNEMLKRLKKQNP